jgi:predicted permease
MKRERGSIRLYRRLLRLLPEDMRRRFGHDMTELLRERLAAVDSRAARLTVWMGAAADLLVHAVQLRFGDRDRSWTRFAFGQDVRQALAGLRAAPGVTVASVLTLGLGVGASTAVFSVVDAVLLDRPAVAEPERLVFVWPEVNGNKAMALLAEAEMASLEDVSGLSSWALTLTGEGEPRDVSALMVSPDYFDMLGVRPVLGRGFREGEDLPGAAGVVVLSHGFWVGTFGADPDVIGRVVDLSGAEYDRRQVVGVMPPGIEDIWRDADVWIPLEGDPALGLAGDDTWYVNERLARLAPGATLEQAGAEVREHAARVQRTIPRTFSTEQAERATVRTMNDYLTADVRTPILVTLGTVLLVLFIGCFNVANLMVARSDRRHRDLAVRAALGAGRGRIVRMLLSESAAVGVAGGSLGVALAAMLVRALPRFAPPDFRGLDSAALDGRVLVFALLATLVATIVAGLVPALRASGVRALSLLGGSTRGAAGSGGGRMTSVLVGGQVALAVVVTLGSGLTLRSLSRLMAVDPGLDGEGVVAFRANPRGGDDTDREAFLAYFREVSERVGALPGVESVGGIHLLPGTPGNWSFPTHPEGFTVPEGAPTPTVNFRAVRGDYFETVRLRILEGRAPGDTDRVGTEPVVAVNQAFVREFWPDVDPIGRTLSIFSSSGTKYRVVGVVGDVHQHGREIEPRAEMYFSHEQLEWDRIGMWFTVRLRPGTDIASIGPAVRETVWAVDPEVPVSEMLRLDDALGQSTRGARFLTLLLGAFGGLALALCAIGVFGVTAYVSGRRAGEFGVRLALGSSKLDIVRSSVLRSLGPVAVGLGLGLLTARLGSDLLDSVLYGVEASDPFTFAGVGLLLAGVGIVAAIVPAWRAANVDPVRVLGSE